MSERQLDSSGDESQKDISAAESSSDEDNSSDKDYGVVDMHPEGNEPYQDEPLAVPGQEYALNFEDDKDGIPAATLEARFTKISSVNEWQVPLTCETGHVDYNMIRRHG